MTTTVDIDTVIAEAESGFPALYQLFGGYFHRDWNREHATPDAALRAFLVQASPLTLAAAGGELQRLLAAGFDEEALTRLLEQGFDCNYVPAMDGSTPSQWLAHVRNVLRT